VTYRAILDRGAVMGSHKILLILGRKLFGRPTAQIRRAIEGITDLPRLHMVQLKTLRASSWEELLKLTKAPPPSRHRGRQPKT
jgi:hypothetical protein